MAGMLLGWARSGCCSRATLTDVAPPYQLYVLGVLVAVSLLQQADQWALPTLQASGLQCSSCGKESGEFYRHCRDQCLELGDVAMGLLTGPAFTFSSVLVSLPLGWMADRWHRTWILCVGLVVWSAATFLATFSSEFWHLALSRIVLGIGGATVAPTAYSLLSDYFHPNKRALVFAFFSITIYLGELVGLLSAFISQEWSWRVAFAALGLPGFGVALLLGVSVREPSRGMSERWAKADTTTTTSLGLRLREDRPGFLTAAASETTQLHAHDQHDDTDSFDVHGGTTWRQAATGVWHRVAFLARLPAFVTHCAVAAVRNAGGYSLGAWLQVFLVRRHGLTPSEFTPWLMVIVPLGGGLGATLGGWLADSWHKRDVRGKAWLIAASQLMAFPFVSYFFLVESELACFLLLFPAYVFAEMWYAPAAAISQDLVFPSLRGLATAVYFCVTSLGALAPLLVGALNGWFDRRAPYDDPDDSDGDDVLDPTFPLVVVVGGSYLLSSLGFGLTSLLMRSHKQRMSAVLAQRRAAAPFASRRAMMIVSADEERTFLGAAAIAVSKPLEVSHDVDT